MRPISGREICRLLVEAGWTLKRIKGSHHIFGKPGERKIITVPMHGNKALKSGLAAAIARDANLSW
ncbi:MAG: type II toxin-antitoxin system HicA family toxin [Verrucomicrobia bacterium]|nr:type II toxin-antitoxin system HicA family toxin [Verrucomicrobiota bacterium]